MKRLRVYGVNSFVDGEQCRVIVVASSMKEAARLIDVAMGKPGTVFVYPTNQSFRAELLQERALAAKEEGTK